MPAPASHQEWISLDSSVDFSGMTDRVGVVIMSVYQAQMRHPVLDSANPGQLA
jgi:hypothetical protein